MTDTRKVQLEASVDASGAKKGFEDIKAGARDMAQAVGQAGEQAGKAVDGIGFGTSGAAQKVDAATRSMIGSIQRATAAAEAGGKATAKYFEAIAAQRGIAPDVLKPFIEQLKQAEQNAQNAGHGMEALSFQTAAAKRELLVLTHELSQGNFKRFGGSIMVLAEQTGAAGLLFSSAALGVGAFVAVAGALAVAAAKGAGELKGFNDAAIMSGNAIGVSASRFTQLRDSLAGIAGSKHAAAEVLTEIAKNGELAGSNIKGIAEAAALMERATGQSVDKTVAQFAELAKAPAEASAKLNEQFNYLTAATYKQIKALEDQGKTQEAADTAERAYADAVKQRAQTVIDSAGTLTKGWRAVAEAAKSAWDSMLNIGREDSLGDKLAKAAANLDAQRARLQGLGQFDTTAGGAAVGGVRLGASGAARAQRDSVAAQQEYQDSFRRLQIEDGNAAALAAQAEQTKARIAFDKAGDEFLTKRQRMEKEITKAQNEGAAAGASQLEIQKRIAGIREKYKDGATSTAGESGIATQRARDVIAKEENARLQKSIDTLDFSQPTKLTNAETRVREIEALIAVQKEQKTVLTDVARANQQKELAAAKAAVVDEKATQVLQQQYDATKKAREEITKQAESMGQQADAIRQQAASQEAANATFGKSKTAIEQMTLAQLKLQLAEADSSDTFDPKYVAALREKTKAQERYVDALQKAEAQQINKSLTEGTRTSQEEAASLQLEMSLVGQTAQARERIVAQRKVELDLAKEIAQIDQSGATDAEKEELRAKARAKARIDSENAANKAVLNEWQRTADSINQSLTDALLRGFESGKTFAQNFRDTLKNMFSTLVLRPIIQAVMAPVSGVAAQYGQAIGGALGGGSGSGYGGAIMNNAGLIGAGYQALTGSSVGASGASLAYANGVGAMGGDGLGALISANGGWAGVAGAGAASTGAAGAATTFGVVDTAAAGASLAAGGGAAAGAGAAGGAAAGGAAAEGAAAAGLAAIPVAGWVALAAVVLYSMFAKKGGGPKAEGYYNPYNSDKYYSSNSAEVMNNARTAAATVQGQYDSIVGLYSGKGGIQFGLGYSTDPKGTAPSMVHLGVGQNGAGLANFTNTNVGRSNEELQAAIQEESNRAILFGLQHSDIKGKIGEYLNSLGDIATISADKVTEAITRIQKASTERESLQQKLFDLTHTDLEKATAARQKERAAIDESNYALYDHVAALTDLTTQLAAQKDQLLQAYSTQSTALQETITKSQQYAKQLRDVRDGLLLSSDSVLSRSQKTALAGGKFSSTLSSAIGGNEDALQALGGTGQDLIAAVRASAHTPAEVAAAIAKVSAGLTTAAASADGRASVAQQQLDAMTKQLTALGLINTSVITVGDALAAYLQTQNAIAQENLNYTALVAQEQATSVGAPPPTSAPSVATAPAVFSVGDNVVSAFDNGVSSLYDNTIGRFLTPQERQLYLSYVNSQPGSGGGIGAYADGGLAPAGLALVGENGPELVDFKTPSRVYTNEQTRGMFGGSAEMATELAALRSEVAGMRVEQRAGAVGTVSALEKIVTIEKKRENIGMPPVRETA